MSIQVYQSFFFTYCPSVSFAHVTEDVKSGFIPIRWCDCVNSIVSVASFENISAVGVHITCLSGHTIDCQAEKKKSEANGMENIPLLDI